MSRTPANRSAQGRRTGKLTGTVRLGVIRVDIAKSTFPSAVDNIAADYVEPGASATDDRRPEFQRMIEAATTKPPAFGVVLVHSFSRFFRDQFQLEFYVRRLAKNGVRLVSITQELGDDPMSNMIRQIMALFGEYQSKENAKHTLRAMKENARQGFWNGACRRLATALSPASSAATARRKPWRSIPFRPRRKG